MCKKIKHDTECSSNEIFQTDGKVNHNWKLLIQIRVGPYKHLSSQSGVNIENVDTLVAYIYDNVLCQVDFV